MYNLLLMVEKDPQFSQEIIESVRNIPSVLKYVGEKRVFFPLQDESLDHEYSEAVKNYFKLTQEGFANPHVGVFIKNNWEKLRQAYSKFGESTGSIENSLVIASVIGAHKDERISMCLLSKTQPELVLGIEDVLLSTFFNWNNGDGLRYKTEVQERRYPTLSVYNRWKFDYTITEKDSVNVSMYRTAQPEDLLVSGMLVRFVKGVGRFFGHLKDIAGEESQMRIGGKEVTPGNIHVVTKAFQDANIILLQALSPTSVQNHRRP